MNAVFAADYGTRRRGHSRFGVPSQVLDDFVPEYEAVLSVA